MSTVLSLQHEIDGQIITCNQYEDKAGAGRSRAAGGGGDSAARGGTTALGSTAVEILNNTIAMISKLRGQMESQVAPQTEQQHVELQGGSELGLQSISRSGTVKLFVGGLAPTTTGDLL